MKTKMAPTVGRNFHSVEMSVEEGGKGGLQKMQATRRNIACEVQRCPTV